MFPILLLYLQIRRLERLGLVILSLLLIATEREEIPFAAQPHGDAEVGRADLLSIEGPGEVVTFGASGVEVEVIGGGGVDRGRGGALVGAAQAAK